MPPDRGPKPSPARRAVLALGVVATLAAAGLAADRLVRTDLPVPIDFAAFWAAGRLNLDGENPYDGPRLRQTQEAVGLTGVGAVVMWNPPWTLALVMPVGALSVPAANRLWVLGTLGLLALGTELLWRGLGGPPGRRWIAYLLALTFVPTTFLAGSGQITAVVFVGLAGYLAAARAGRPYLAGALAALTAVKPHLLTLFSLWLLLEAGRDAFGRRVALGAVLVGLLLCVPPTLTNPAVWEQYVAAATGPPPADHRPLSAWKAPLVGWWVRMAVPGQPFWVQVMPLAVGAVALLAWYARAAQPAPGPDRAAGLAGRLPWLVGLSLLVAPYGVWPFDLVLLLVPVLAVAARLAGRPAPAPIAVGLVWLGVVNAVMLILMLSHASTEWYVWCAPTVLAGCLVTGRLASGPATAPRPAPAAA